MISTPLLILAGGKATRLGALSEKTPKFLMPIDSGRCFADLQLAWAKQQGFSEVILSVGYLGDQVKKYCDTGERFGLKIRYSFDGDTALGTGGAVKKALADVDKCVAVTYGDTLLSLSCQDVIADARKHSAFAYMTVFKNTVPGHVCNAELRQNLVEYSKSASKDEYQFIDYGFLVLSPDFVKSIPEGQAIDLAVSLEKASKAQRLLGTEVKERFWEMGTPESLTEFKKRF